MSVSTQATPERIAHLLEGLPPESLAFVEQLALFLREQSRQGQPVAPRAPYLYPTVPVPASVFTRLTGIMPPVGGDALADSESLYDEA